MLSLNIRVNKGYIHWMVLRETGPTGSERWIDTVVVRGGVSWGNNVEYVSFDSRWVEGLCLRRGKGDVENIF